MSELKEKSKAHLIKGLKPVAHLLKTWYLDVGYDFINSKKFSAAEEDMLEKVSDYYLSRMKELK